MKRKIVVACKVILLVCVLNISITTGVDRFKHDHLTEVQLFKRIPQTFWWNFS